MLIAGTGSTCPLMIPDAFLDGSSYCNISIVNTRPAWRHRVTLGHMTRSSTAWLEAFVMITVCLAIE